ncbi:hypothetical protein DPM19_30180 [Actinomadura craniellae]|uniref:ATP-grasp domain-containing protein n=1 Tax=Actinomadura craniellae TaxID=2231787 RepID=A0A365GXP4_9ACTN|nr:hypothetical protein [Actinomadura craniellae]RAY11601.1 hypothetical protein DPM19_30180 [Actinomadura craniellae]
MSVAQLKIALVTARQRPEVNVDHDMSSLCQALLDAGVSAEAAAWDDPSLEWSSFDLVVIRSPWDYSWRSTEFLSWVDEAATKTRLANPAKLVHWNANKEYLKVLAEKGVPVVPTSYIWPEDPIELPRDHEFVVKPAVGAGARYAARYRPEESAAAAEHVAKIQATGVPVMMQPYLHNIDVTGERALVFLHGTFLHAIRKRAVLSPGLRFDAPRDAHPGTEPWTPTADERALAAQALEAVPNSRDLLYARVDMADGPDGRPIITELELVEPGLYLRFHKGSERVFADAIIRHAQSVTREGA